MRIIAGTFRSRTLEAPAGMTTRPTSDRLRETLFNVIAPRIEGARFLDLYAGSGAVGIEALSRGAACVEFIEKAPAALKALRGNLDRLGIKAGLRIHAGAVTTVLQRMKTRAPTYNDSRFDLIFIDPPYDADQEYESTLGLLGSSASGVLADDALVIAEHRKQDGLGERYGRLTRVRLLKQGDAALSFYAFAVDIETSNIENLTGSGNGDELLI
jgi:16S rRNA (guanine966-N2)-methyltransferase